MLNVGIIGLGFIASIYGDPTQEAPYCHVGGIMQSDAVRLAGVADMSEAARDKFREVWGETFPDAAYFDSSGALLGGQVPDIVAVCVRGPFHFPVMREVIAARPRAIFLEKPPVCSLQEADELLHLARENGISITVSYSRHWAPHVLAMSELVRNGLIGRVHTVVGYCGGATLSYASHTTDLLCQFAGYDPVSVAARAVLSDDAPRPPAHKSDYEPEMSLQNLQIEFASGAVGLQVGPRGEHGQFYADVFGETGRVRVGMYLEPQAFDLEGNPLELPPMPPRASPFKAAYEQIAAHLSGGPLPDCSGAGFVAVNEIGFAAIESAHQNGARISLPGLNRSRKIWADG